MEFESGLAAPVRHDADALQGHRIAKAGAHRLRKSLLGGKAVGHEEYGIDGFRVSRPFALGQHAARKPLAVFIEQPFDPVRFDHIDADAVNHARAAAIAAR